MKCAPFVCLATRLEELEHTTCATQEAFQDNNEDIVSWLKSGKLLSAEILGDISTQFNNRPIMRLNSILNTYDMHEIFCNWQISW